jgi:hypothetical protein
LDHQKLVTQLVSLERRTARGGKDSIDHPRGDGWHDDIANAVAGLVGMLATQSTYGWSWEAIGGPDPNKDEAAQTPSWAEPQSLFRHPSLQGVAWLGYHPFR